MTDHQLMLLVRDGELQKLEPLFERHHHHLYNFFLKQTNNRTVSEDLTQDVFFRILKYRHTYRQDGQFITWMFSIGHRVKIDYYKKKSRKHDALEDPDLLAHPGPGPDDEMDIIDQRALIREAMQKLKPEQREILMLARYDEMKYEDIAKVLDIKVGTVKARVHRAMKAFSHQATQLTKGDPS